jgi:PAS domain S-box-containing protein
LRDENGKLMGYQSAVMDITERKLAEAELLKIQKQYRDLVESTSDLVTRVDVNGHFLFMNHTARKIYGFVSEDCVGRLAFDFIHPEDRAATEVAFQAWLKSGMEEFKFENRMVDISGQIHYMEWLIRSEHDENGNVKGFASTARDISDRKNAEAEKVKLEEQARQLQKTESLGRMSGAIAHHFNNQLQVVMGYLEMVIGDLPLSSPSIVNLTIAMQATKKASEVSGLLLSYLGQKPVKLESLDLTELCHTILPVLQAGMPKDIVMETDLPSPGPFISADAKQIRQLLTNLAINAWEAIGDKAGIIRIAVRTVSSRDIPASHRFPVQWCPLEQQYVCLEVRDSGCGIEEKDIENLFDPFFSTKFAGRGLGLSVVLGIVRAHSIAITVESGIGGGSVFRVFFSLSPQPPERRIPKVPNIIFGDTVLLVEDNNAVREVTRIVLVDLGFTVFQARDGVEAVEIFEQHKDEISWLFCDLTMPRMGGWETIFAIRTIRHDLPVVLASGYDDVRAMEGEHPELPDFFLQKPYDMNKLCEMTGRSTVIARSS